MHKRFISITNELHCLGEIIKTNKLIRKILSVLPPSWESKVNSITQSNDFQILNINKLIENLKTYEFKRQQDQERQEPKNKKCLALKAAKRDSSDDNAERIISTGGFRG